MSSIRLWLAKKIMPRGYALWEYGQGGDDRYDELVIAKEASP